MTRKAKYWVEDNGMIIDTTILANSQFKILNDFSITRVNEIKDTLEKRVCYIPYYELSNKLFTLQCQEFYAHFGCNTDKIFKIIENYLGSIVQSVEKDNDFISKVKNDFGCELKKDYLCFGIK